MIFIWLIVGMLFLAFEFVRAFLILTYWVILTAANAVKRWEVGR